MLPFSYAIRNLFRDPVKLAQTVLGSGAVVLLVMAAVAINQGMTGVLGATGSPRNVMLVGAGSEESVQRSEVADRAAGIAEASLTDIQTVFGERAVSPEIIHMTFVSTELGAERRQVMLRGVTSRALLVRPEVEIAEGRFTHPGGLLVGRLAWKRLGLPRERLQPGQKLMVEDRELVIAGVFAAPGTVMESELWMDLNDLRTFSQRDNLSCVVLRMAEGGAFEDIDLFTKQRLDLELSAVRESDYYAGLSSFYSPLRSMTWVTALLIAVGGVLGGLNTLYAAFASRIREIGTLQAMGYSRRSVLLSLMQESLLASLCGALLAALLAVGLLDGLTVSFSIGSFVLRVSPAVALVGLGTGVALGLIGALPPALRCLLPPLPQALRASG